MTVERGFSVLSEVGLLRPATPCRESSSVGSRSLSTTQPTFRLTTVEVTCVRHTGDPSGSWKDSKFKEWTLYSEDGAGGLLPTLLTMCRGRTTVRVLSTRGIPEVLSLSRRVSVPSPWPPYTPTLVVSRTVWVTRANSKWVLPVSAYCFCDRFLYSGNPFSSTGLCFGRTLVQKGLTRVID